MLSPTGVSREEVERNGRKLVRRTGRQVLLISTGGRIFAIANRCPHEGYPLSEGTLGPDCVLTCNWHNWKFDLENGETLVGRDPVRTYVTEIREGEIFVDLADPPAEAQRARALKGLEAAVADNDAARMAREVARIERAGFDADDGLVHVFAVRNNRLEDGMTHAHAAAADWCHLSSRARCPEERLAALLEALAHIAWDTQGVGEFPYARAIEQWDANAFVAALEAEDESAAVARIRGALAAGIPYSRLQPVIGEAALAHYADFGHCAIYTLKTGHLIERLGDGIAEPALLALTRMLARATREERLPEFRAYARALAEWDGTGSVPARAQDFAGLSIEGALRRTVASSGRPARELYDALLGAAGFNLLRFDTGFDEATRNHMADNIGWLDFTHALTFANACRHICEEREDLWPRAALQMALFVGRNGKYVNHDVAVEHWRAGGHSEFISREMHTLFDHGIVEPIIACHRLKMLFALEDELNSSPGAPWADEMCAGMNRYLHTPMKRRHGLRTATQALDFVAKEV